MSSKKESSKIAIPAKLKPNDSVFIIFGATGDLTKRKLLPGIFHLAVASLMPERYGIIGCAPENTGTDSGNFPSYVRNALETFGRKEVTDKVWDSFSDNLTFVPLTRGDLSNLVETVTNVESKMTDPQRIIYLAVPPGAFLEMIDMLKSSGLVNSATRLVIEKPFGHDLESARDLNATLQKVFDESQIFRMDHFLGKEAVQNILAFRFANSLFESAWSSQYIDYVQIDIPESLTIEGRAAFYEANGAFRDMVVTHLFQLLGFLAMEPPVRLDAPSLHDKKIEVYNAMDPIDVSKVIFGQYRGYRSEPGVKRDSQVETFAALEVRIENERWSGVPWYLRTGKALAESRNLVTLGFKESPLHMFEMGPIESSKIRPNELTFDLSDPGSVTLHFLVKEPGITMDLEPACATFQYDESTLVALELEPYERLIHDVMLGEHLLFNRADAIERLWEVASPLLNSPPVPVPYAKGSWGPSPANALVSPRKWYLPDGS